MSATDERGSGLALAHELLTPKETAQVLRLSRSSVYRLIHDEAIPSVVVGGSIRVPRRALLLKLQRTAQGFSSMQTRAAQ